MKSNSLNLLRRAYWWWSNKKDMERFWRHPNRWCAVCDRRIWWFQRGVHVYSLGDNRAHISCTAEYLADEIRWKYRSQENKDAHNRL